MRAAAASPFQVSVSILKTRSTASIALKSFVKFTVSLSSKLHLPLLTGLTQLQAGSGFATPTVPFSTLSSLLFALAIHPAITHTLTAHPNTRAVAIHDDVTFLGAPSDVIAATLTFRAAASSLCLEIQGDKCALLRFKGPVPDLSAADSSNLLRLGLDLGPEHYATSSRWVFGIPLATIGRTLSSTKSTTSMNLFVVLTWIRLLYTFRISRRC